MALLPSLNQALSGLQAFQQDINVIGNNIANVNTTGFKTNRIDFEDTFSQMVGGDPSIQVGTGVATADTQSNFGGGTIGATGVGTDLAIDGGGFFLVKDTLSGQQYLTRAGDFHLDSSGYLVNPDGLRVQGYTTGGASASIGDLKIDATGAASPTATLASFVIDSTGHINVTMSDGTSFVRGQVLLQNCADPNALTKQGNNLFTATTAAGLLSQAVVPQSAGVGTLKAGALETSNVDLTTEMANLITAQRAFEANAKIVTTSDQVLATLVNLKQ